jgi:hypothetical protein
LRGSVAVRPKGSDATEMLPNGATNQAIAVMLGNDRYAC